MMNRSMVTMSVVLGLAFSAAASADDASKSGWKQIAPGVYQATDADGTVTRMAYGAEGARYDRGVLNAEIDALVDKVANGLGTEQDARSIDELRLALDGIPDPGAETSRAGGAPQPAAADTGLLCGFFSTALDSHFAVGAGGASSIARVGFAGSGFGPPVALNSIAQYARATLTPSGGAQITNTQSNATSAELPIAQVNWRKGIGDGAFVVAGDCSATTYSYIQITAGNGSCTGAAGFVSQTKNYTQCVGSL